jgi:hypothetical protein
VVPLEYRGVIVADALGTHEAGARASPGIVLAGCWAHVYRRSKEAAPDHSDAERALAWIGALYELDRSAGDDDALRAELRRAKAPAILDELKAWLWTHAEDHVALDRESGRIHARDLGPSYALRRRRADPTRQQRHRGAIRGPVVGRRNHYGSKSRRGTEVASRLYTILETCKLHDVDPATYLHAAVIAVGRGDALLPWDFAAQS